MADCVLSDDEAEEIRQWIALWVGDGYVDPGIPNIGTTAQLGEPLSDPVLIASEIRCLVLTGPMRMGTRAFITKGTERCGGGGSG